jgi:hypothetical protein
MDKDGDFIDKVGDFMDKDGDFMDKRGDLVNRIRAPLAGWEYYTEFRAHPSPHRQACGLLGVRLRARG